MATVASVNSVLSNAAAQISQAVASKGKKVNGGGFGNGQSEIDRLRAEIAELKAKATHKQTLSLKVSEKGGISVYGLGRFPVTLYAQQWVRLFGISKSIMEFMEENKATLTFKE